MLFYVTHFDDIYEKKNFFSLRLSLTVSWNKQIREGSFDLRIYEHTERKFLGLSASKLFFSVESRS